jgi:spore germination cell wall hydrolase CwlJ-like protein
MSEWQYPVPDPNLAPALWPDLMVLASTLLGEAEGEPYEGKVAVAHVIMNRARDKRWPDLPGMVCLQHLQFSCWNRGSPRYAAMLTPKKHVSAAVWADCFRAACAAMMGFEPDPTHGANHYLAPGSLEKLPSWADPARKVARIARHDFYRL